MNREQEIAWLAGILEGEGCFAIRSVRGYPSGNVSMQSTDEDIVMRVYAAVEFRGQMSGPHMYASQTFAKKPHWRWHCTKKEDIIAICQTLYPFMGIRRREAITKLLDSFPSTHYRKEVLGRDQLRLGTE